MGTLVSKILTIDGTNQRATVFGRVIASCDNGKWQIEFDNHDIFDLHPKEFKWIANDAKQTLLSKNSSNEMVLKSPDVQYMEQFASPNTISTSSSSGGSPATSNLRNDNENDQEVCSSLGQEMEKEIKEE